LRNKKNILSINLIFFKKKPEGSGRIGVLKKIPEINHTKRGPTLTLSMVEPNQRVLYGEGGGGDL